MLTQKRLDYDGTNHVTFVNAFQYDGLNRVTKSIDQGPDGDITSATDNLATVTFYDGLGRTTKTQDPAGIQTAYLYNTFSLLTRTTEDTAGIGRYTDRLYDRAGRLTKLTGYTGPGATGGQSTVYAYNKAGLQTRVTYPDDAVGDRGYVVYQYDAALRLTRLNDQRNISLDFNYDSMGRVLTKKNGTSLYWTFVYAPDGQVVDARKGTSAGGTQISRSEYAYDGLLRLTRHSQSIGAVAAKSNDFLHDRAGRVTSMTYPGGTTIARTFTPLGQLDTILRSSVELADYDYTGTRVQTLTYETGANDVQATRDYDGIGRMTRLQWTQTGNTLPDLRYAYDSTSNITRKIEAHRPASPVEAYQHDTLHRLRAREHAMQRRRMNPSGFTWGRCHLLMVMVCALIIQACDSEANRYVLTPVPAASLVGTWYVDKASLSDMNRTVSMPGAAEFFPWQMLQLNPDGTFTVNGRIFSQAGRLQTVPETVSGHWEVIMDTYAARPSKATMVKLMMKTQGADGLRHVSVERLIVMDDGKQLVLWMQIGDLDARQYQEYVRPGAPLAQVDE